LDVQDNVNDDGERVELSILVPCFNEADHIKPCLESVLSDIEHLPYEVLIIDGRSTDGTIDIVREMQCHNPRIRLLDNSHRLQAYALNIGIQNSHGDILIRIDAHSIYPPGYVRRCMDLSVRTGAENVGGIMQPVGRGLAQRAIAVAIQHPLGSGNSPHRRGHRSGYCDTVYLGTYRRSVFERVGQFDPWAHPNEDAEMDWRIRKSGGRVYVDHTLRVSYSPRSSLSALAVQYYHYGRGRAYTTIKHKTLTSYRQMAAPALVLILSASVVGLPLFPYLASLPLSYGGSLIAASMLSRMNEDWRVRALLPVVFATMHVAWGVGFLGRFVQLLWKASFRPVSTPLQSA
jgi:succinoglycan biosynthesis protein ExoA